MCADRVSENNYVSACRGLSYVGNATLAYTNEKLKELHEDIYQNTAGNPSCNEECSNKHGVEFHRWCDCCKEWKHHLEKTHAARRTIQWAKMHSWKWPTSYEYMAEIYLPSNWTETEEVKLADISTACHIWKNCKRFNIRDIVVKNLQKVRNDYIAHNLHEFKLSEIQESKVFDALQDLIRVKDVQGCLDVQCCVDNLAKIRNNNPLESHTEELKKYIKDQGIDDLRNHIKEQDVILRKTQELIVDTLKQKDTIANLKQIIRSVFHQFSRHRNIICMAVLVVVSVCTGIYLLTTSGDKKTPRRDCIPETYSQPFPQDLPLLDYFKDHSELIGREWLFTELENDLIRNNDSHGIVIFAPIGYGKSALVSHMICADKNSKGRPIRDRVVAFHICRFDVEATRSPERFVRRLVGFLSTESPEYGSLINLLPNTSVIFNRESCGDEAEACFDQGVINPLKELNRQWKHQNVKPQWIIAIDALDECYETSLNKNPIKQILLSKARTFPKWIKLLITSRNISISNKRLSIKYLNPQDPRNLEDIRSFIETKFANNTKEFENLINKSEGSFLHITNAVEHIAKTGRSDLPSDLGEIYEINFDRQFEGKAESYKIAKSILEVLSATLNPISIQQIYNILNGSLVCNTKQFDMAVNKLSFFLSNLDGNVNLVHKSLHEWLTDDSNDIYRISIENGHMYISNYMFSHIPNATSNQFLDLTIHVAHAGDSSLISLYKSTNITAIWSTNTSTLLNDLISRRTSAKELALLIHHLPLVNLVDTNGFSPSFVAARHGHTKQLQLLSKHGANLSYIVHENSCLSVSIGQVFTDIQRIKNIQFTSYTSLHIASKYGHEHTVRFLLKTVPALLDIRTATNQRAVEIACENGHVKVVQEMIAILRKESNYDDCLYFAAKNNHLDIIKLIKQLSNGFCITDKSSIRAYERIVDAPKCPGNIYFLNVQYANHLDLWHIVYKETPLHRAVRSGATESAAYIIEAFPTLLECKDAFGYTPALLSIRYNRTEIFETLLNQASRDKCSLNIPHALNNTLIFHDSVYSNIEEQWCPDGAYFAHLMVMYNTNQMMTTIHHKLNNISWDKPDNDGNHPIHYAARHKSIVFINTRYILHIDANKTTTRNGSTPYHIAALHLQYESMIKLTSFKGFRILPPDVRNSYNMSILHTLVIHGPLDYSSIQQFWQLKMFVYFKDHDITVRDTYGRNILHYILTNGHSHILNYLLQRNFSTIHNMVSEMDNARRTPVGNALRHGTGPTSIVSSTVDALFASKSIQLDQYETYMLPWEYGLCLLLKSLNKSEIELLFLPHFEQLMLKSAIVTKALITFHENIRLNTVHQQQLASAMKHLPTSLHLCWSTFLVLKRRPNNLLVCGKSFSQSPIHAYVLNQDKIGRLYSFELGHDEIIEHIVQKNLLDKNCTDDRHFNLVHYSLIGGNIPVAEYLANHGIELVNEKVTFVDIIFMTQFARHKERIGRDVLCNKTDQNICTDVYLSKLLLENQNSLNHSDLCRNGSTSLSLVHILAMNGMTKSLEALATVFNTSVLICVNRFRFTPLYFAALFNRSVTVAMLERYTVFQFPDIVSETVLVLNILHGYPQLKRANPFQCLSQMSYRFTNRNIIKIFHCFLHHFPHQRTIVNEHIAFTFSFHLEHITLLHTLFDTYYLLDLRTAGGISNCQDLRNDTKELFKQLRALRKWTKLSHCTLEYVDVKRSLSKATVRNIRRIFVYLDLVGKPCTTYEVTSPLGILRFQKLLSLVKHLVRVSLKMLRDIMTHLWIIVVKSLLVSVTPMGEFFQSRIDSMTCGISCPVSDNVVKHFLSSKYLRVIKTTLAYKQLRVQVSHHYFPSDYKKKQNYLLNIMHDRRKRRKYVQNRISQSVSCKETLHDVVRSIPNK